MPYDAITVDSNIFVGLGLNLEAGLLAQLAQFKGGPADLVLSEVVAREIFKHLRNNGKKARDTAHSALARVEALSLADGDNLAVIAAAKAAIGDPGEVTNKRFGRFLANTGAVIVPASLCDMDELLKNYFAPQPPFASSGDKKSEFPDAIALISLQKWAADKGKTILAVSADKGWGDFAEKSAQIDVQEDLAKALEIVQEHAEAAEQAIANFIGLIENGNLPEKADTISQWLKEGLAEWHFHPEGCGSFHLEGESTGLEIEGFEYEKIEDDLDITIVRMGNETVVARIAFSTVATASADFSLSIWDSIDKEYVGMGSQSATRELEFEGAFLLTLSGDLNGPLADLEVEGLEVVEAPDEVDFGEIEFDPGDYDEYSDFEVLPDDVGDVDAQADAQSDGEAAAGQPPF